MGWHRDASGSTGFTLVFGEAREVSGSSLVNVPCLLFPSQTIDGSTPVEGDNASGPVAATGDGDSGFLPSTGATSDGSTSVGDDDAFGSSICGCIDGGPLSSIWGEIAGGPLCSSSDWCSIGEASFNFLGGSFGSSSISEDSFNSSSIWGGIGIGCFGSSSIWCGIGGGSFGSSSCCGISGGSFGSLSIWGDTVTEFFRSSFIWDGSGDDCFSSVGGSGTFGSTPITFGSSSMGGGICSGTFGSSSMWGGTGSWFFGSSTTRGANGNDSFGSSTTMGAVVSFTFLSTVGSSGDGSLVTRGRIGGQLPISGGGGGPSLDIDLNGNPLSIGNGGTTGGPLLTWGKGAWPSPPISGGTDAPVPMSGTGGLSPMWGGAGNDARDTSPMCDGINRLIGDTIGSLTMGGCWGADWGGKVCVICAI